jgi:two-component system NarL family sensor kinase
MPETEPRPVAATWISGASAAWVEMLARIGGKHARLSSLAGALPNRRPGSSLIEEIEKERGRIARELHAGAGQPLAGIKINLESVDQLFLSMPQSIPAEVREAIARIHHLTDAALSQVRAVSHRLHPPHWQLLSVVDALRLLVNESGVTRKCATELTLGPLPIEPSHTAKVVLYRCAQECISNVLRHSGASRFALTLIPAASAIHMIISDNGCGVPADAATRGGIGLASIREHVRAVEGRFGISSTSEGTTIQVSLPLMED